MKSIILAFVFLCFFNIDVQAQINDSANHGLMLLTTKKNENMNSVQGSPYLEDKFQVGTVIFGEKEPLQVFLRYDISRETMEIKTDMASEEIFTLPAHIGAEYHLGDNKILYDEINYEGDKINGYFIEHYKGDKVRLLEKPTITVTEPVKARTGYEKDKPAEIIIGEEFYVIMGDGEVRNVRAKHRDVKKAFTSNLAKKYLKENRIRSTEDLTSFVAYLDN